MGTARELVAGSGEWPAVLHQHSWPPKCRSSDDLTCVQLQRLEVLCNFFGHGEVGAGSGGMERLKLEGWCEWDSGYQRW